MTLRRDRVPNLKRWRGWILTSCKKSEISNDGKKNQIFWTLMFTRSDLDPRIRVQVRIVIIFQRKDADRANERGFSRRDFDVDFEVHQNWQISVMTDTYLVSREYSRLRGQDTESCSEVCWLFIVVMNYVFLSWLRILTKNKNIITWNAILQHSIDYSRISFGQEKKSVLLHQIDVARTWWEYAITIHITFDRAYEISLWRKKYVTGINDLDTSWTNPNSELNIRSIV